jgi:hypothetical protein
MTVAEAFLEFKTELELPDREQSKASTTQQKLRGEISKYLYVPNSFLTGSYSRYTKISPLKDIDVFLVRNDRRTGLATYGNGISPSAALDEVVAAVRMAYPLSAMIEKQNRSVNVEINGTPFGFDLTPAWLRTPDGYWIPDSDSGNWIPSDPDSHAEKMRKANDAQSGNLKPVIKMVKHWSRNNYDLLRSFHIELICVDIFSAREIDSYRFGVATVLVNLGRYVGRKMMDPVYGLSRIDKVLTADEYEQLIQRVNYDAENAIAAIRLEAEGKDYAAIEKWKHIFVRGFPR